MYNHKKNGHKWTNEMIQFNPSLSLINNVSTPIPFHLFKWQNTELSLNVKKCGQLKWDFINEKVKNENGISIHPKWNISFSPTMGAAWIRADVIKPHLLFGTTGLTLEEDSFFVTTFGAGMIFSSWQCRIRNHISNNLSKLTEKLLRYLVNILWKEKQ